MFRRVGVTVLACVASVAMVTTASAVSASGQTVAPTEVSAKGIGPVPKGAGMGTKAALENPKCDAAAVDGWGVFDFITEGAGPYCVAPAPADNGGATARGVTRTTIRVVALVQNEAQTALQKSQNGLPPVDQATGGLGKMTNAVNDYWAAYASVYETWGRKVEFTFITSSGDDEASQRADAVKAAAAKPFAVIDFTPTGQSAFAATLAQQKYVVFSSGTTSKESTLQSPYRWAQSDTEAASINTAEFAGKQLVGKKAQWAGDSAMKSQPRKFGIVYPDTIDISAFVTAFAKYGGKLATKPLEYTSNGSTVGDPATAQEQAPTIISALKAAGVTSVIMFTDVSMGGSMTKVATQQEYRPEWVTTGYNYQNLALLARTSYDQDQWAHAFGLNTLWPCALPNCTTGSPTAIEWYYGVGTGHDEPLGDVAGGMARNRDPVRRTDVEREELQAGPVRSARPRRRCLEPADQRAEWLRQDGWARVRRVRAAERRLRPVVVRRARNGDLRVVPHIGAGCELVPRQRSALHRR